MSDLFTWHPAADTAPAPASSAPSPAPFIREVRDLRFTCPGCDAPVSFAFAPSNQVLLCGRCAMWGVDGHRRLRDLRQVFRAMREEATPCSP